MTISFTHQTLKTARPIYLVKAGTPLPSALSERSRAFADAVGFDGQNQKCLLLPGDDGTIEVALFGIGQGDDPMVLGGLSGRLPGGDWALADMPFAAEIALMAIKLGAYRFTRYKEAASPEPVRISHGDRAAISEAERLADACNFTRDLINTPTSDMGPEALEAAVRALAKTEKASIKVIKGDQLLKKNFPMIHAVGRASIEAPRLIDLQWGDKAAPKVTLVGKGVCFDTGGLDIKPASSMLLMKKDMGGAANVLGLAKALMAAKAKIRLRVLIPAVENSISSNAFRPSDILTARDGQTVEIGHTDAEGRLVLADALVLASEEKPDLLVDMATLTGAARVALGPDLPPYFTDDEALATEINATSQQVMDPLWRLPLWAPYAPKLKSLVADVNNVTKDGFAGAITAGLFLKRFVGADISWVHLDLYGWNPVSKPHAPVGGEAQSIRTFDALIRNRFGCD